jgi:hypothetical protein
LTANPFANFLTRIEANPRRAFEDEGLPVISVDTKKKELIGRFKNRCLKNTQSWPPKKFSLVWKAFACRVSLVYG